MWALQGQLISEHVPLSNPRPQAPDTRCCRRGETGFAANSPGCRFPLEKRQAQNRRCHSTGPQLLCRWSGGNRHPEKVSSKEKGGPL